MFEINHKPQSQNTSISYLYRDASNYKVYESIIFVGPISDEDITLILGKLDHGVFFLPEQVGLPTLYGSFDQLCEDDHVWHELERDDIELTNQPATTSSNIISLVEKFKSISDWDIISADRNLRNKFRNN